MSTRFTTLEKIPLPLGRKWGWGLPPKEVTNRCAMGVDVADGRWDVAIIDVHRPWKHKPDHMPYRLVFSGKVRDEKDVIWLAFQYPVVCGGIDSRPNGELAQRLVNGLRKARKDFWRIQYNTNPSSIEFTPNEKARLITIERTMTMDDVFHAMGSGQGLALPENYLSIADGEFASELKAPTRVQVEWHGQDVPRWTEKEADHSFHCLNYATFMARYCNLWVPRDSDVMASPGFVRAPGVVEVGGIDRARRDPFGEDDAEDADWRDFHSLEGVLGGSPI